MKTLPCNHCGLPIEIPEKYARAKSAEHAECAQKKDSPTTHKPLVSDPE